MFCGPIAWSISWPWAACRVDRKHAKETLLRGNGAYCSEGAQKADAAPEGTASLLLLHMAAELDIIIMTDRIHCQSGLRSQHKGG